MSISIDRKRVSIYVCGEHERRQPDVHEIYDRFIWWSILTRTNYLLEEFRIILYEGIGNSYDIAVTPVLMDRYLRYVPPDWPIVPEAVCCRRYSLSGLVVTCKKTVTTVAMNRKSWLKRWVGCWSVLSYLNL